MHALLKQYLDFLHYERGLSEHTRHHYERDLSQLLAHFPELEALKEQAVRRHMATLHGQGLSSASIARMLSSWRGFFHYLVHHQGFKHNPVVGLRAPKSPRTLPNTLNIEQTNKLIELEGDDPLTLRDKAILELFYSSGLRLNELVSLNLTELDLAQGLVTVTGKGNKTRTVPMGSKAIQALNTWLQCRPIWLTQDPNQPAVFVNKQGKRITGRNIEYRIKAWAVKQGLNTSVHPHMLRHSFASHVLQSSGDLRAVQEMLGHANISTTQIYTHLDYQHLTKVYDQAHPRARKK